MLFFFYGSDTEKSRARARGVLDVMKKKRPEAEYFRVIADTWNPASFEEFMFGQGLFERKFIVFADGLFEHKEAREWVGAHAKELGSSENAFVFLEKTLDAATIKKFEKVAQEVKKFESVGDAGKSRRTGERNIFSLADALGKRNKKELWTLLTQSLMQGTSPEEINGVLFWQVKAMFLSRDAVSANAAGLSPFVYAKSKRYARDYTPGQLRDLSRTLISLYHDAHRGLHDFAIGLERLALKL